MMFHNKMCSCLFCLFVTRFPSMFRPRSTGTGAQEPLQRGWHDSEEEGLHTGKPPGGPTPSRTKLDVLTHKERVWEAPWTTQGDAEGEASGPEQGKSPQDTQVAMTRLPQS